jgi:hypothetical protein
MAASASMVDYYNRHVRVEHTLRSKKRIDMVEYLTDFSEVDAYAHDIAMELRFYYPDRSLGSLLNQIDTLRRVQGFYMYKSAFRGLDWTELRKLLLKKVVKWYKSANPPSRIVRIQRVGRRVRMPLIPEIGAEFGPKTVKIGLAG